MLIPEKYTDYNTCILSVSAQIIRILRQSGPMMYNAVMNSVQSSLGENSKYEFQNSLSFLFLLGKIKYYSESDILELVS